MSERTYELYFEDHPKTDDLDAWFHLDDLEFSDSTKEVIYSSGDYDDVDHTYIEYDYLKQAIEMFSKKYKDITITLNENEQKFSDTLKNDDERSIFKYILYYNNKDHGTVIGLQELLKENGIPYQYGGEWYKSFGNVPLDLNDRTDLTYIGNCGDIWAEEKNGGYYSVHLSKDDETKLVYYQNDGRFIPVSRPIITREQAIELLKKYKKK